MYEIPPHFRAKIRVFTLEEGGRGYFVFPESGTRAVPIQIEGTDSINTIGISHEPAKINGGEDFEADSIVSAEDVFQPMVTVGARFHIWDGRFIASGEILEVFWDNWTEVEKTQRAQRNETSVPFVSLW